MKVAAARLSSVAMKLAEPSPAVYTFSITGGPCAGKTTAMSHLLTNQESIFPSFKVEVVPEAATLYHQYGARLPFGQPKSLCGRVSENGRNVLWELLLNELKRSLEARVVNTALARAGPSIVLCDRGIFDSRAYLPTTRDWKSMLQLAGWEESELALRYDHVFHLRMCPAAAYSSANNDARRETYDEALALDSATWDAWDATHARAHSLVGGADGDETMQAKLEALSLAMQRRVEEGARPPSPKRSAWYLPPDAIIALADTVAASPDLSQIAPTAISIVRRVQRVDRLYPSNAEADSLREAAVGLASAISEESGLDRDISSLEDPESPLAF